MAKDRFSPVVLFIASLAARKVHGSAAEFALYSELLSGYNRLERPVANFSQVLNVRMGVELQQIIDVDEINQFIDMNAWLNFEWHDAKLKWNPADYNMISDLRFGRADVWTPDILLYNSADKSFDATYSCNVVANADGTVAWIPPGIFRSSCKMDVRWFPFDVQTCDLKFGSWSYNTWQLDLLPKDPETGVDTSEYLDNGEWTLHKTGVLKQVVSYATIEGRPQEPFTAITFSIAIARRQTYFLLNIIFPCVLISSMSILSFYLPPNSGERMSIGMTVLLSVTLFLNLLSETTPKTSEATPLIGAFFATCLLMSTMSVISSVIILNMHYKNHVTATKISGLAKLAGTKYRCRHSSCRCIDLESTDWTAKGRARLVANYRPGGSCAILRVVNGSKELTTSLHKMVEQVERDQWQKHGRRRGALDPAIGPLSQLDNDGTELDQEAEHVDDKAGSGGDASKASVELRAGPGAQGARLLLSAIHNELSVVTNRMRQQDVDDAILQEWCFAASVVDRTCLILFGTAFVCTCAYFAISVPHWNP